MTIHDRMKEATGCSGFSIVELCIVLTVVGTLMGFAILNMTSIQTGMDSNESMYQIVDILRNGRELAIAQRRRVEVEFKGKKQITLVRHNIPNGTDELSSVKLKDGYSFIEFDLPDTPDALGNSDAVCFQNTKTISFLPDGTLVGDDNYPRSGSLFLGQKKKPETARAITIIGTTGRIRSYRWTGSEWIQ